MALGDVCKHDRLARSCDECFMEAELTAATEQIATLEASIDETVETGIAQYKEQAQAEIATLQERVAELETNYSTFVDQSAAFRNERDTAQRECVALRKVGIQIERGLPSNSEDGGWGGRGDPIWAAELRQAIAQPGTEPREDKGTAPDDGGIAPDGLLNDRAGARPVCPSGGASAGCSPAGAESLLTRGLEAARVLLREADCPDDGCCDGWIPDYGGGDDAESQPCQWCARRQQALAAIDREDDKYDKIIDEYLDTTPLPDVIDREKMGERDSHAEDVEHGFAKGDQSIEIRDGEVGDGE